MDCFNTQPPEGGCPHFGLRYPHFQQFQHTATRRWLPHSFTPIDCKFYCFNTQPPEGGCFVFLRAWIHSLLFQHTATRRWLLLCLGIHQKVTLFQHTATRRWLPSRLLRQNKPPRRFNTQPPEGGCSLHKKMIKISKLFTVFRYPLKHKEWEGV